MFLLFAGLTYYPIGGWKDCVGSFFTVESAIEAAANAANIDWWHVVSVGENKIVAEGKR